MSLKIKKYIILQISEILIGYRSSLYKKFRIQNENIKFRVVMAVSFWF